MIVRRRFDFEAAHRLPHHPGKCRELHGHSYKLVVSVDLPVDPLTGLAIDFSDLNRTVNEVVVSKMDHKYINDFIENPTAEVMVQWIWKRLDAVQAGLVELELHETQNCSVVYRGA